MKVKFCDRCKGQLDGSYHDGRLILSSPKNRGDLGLRNDGFVELCDDCYWQYHHAMKFWFSGKDAKVIKND